MIQSISLRNFKGIRRADVALERLTMIVGPNASGKTSILEGLHLLSQLGTQPPERVFSGDSDPHLLYRRDASGEVLELSLSGVLGCIRLRIIPPKKLSDDPLPPPQGPMTPSQWTFHVEGKEGNEATSDWRVIGDPPAMARFVGPADLLRLDASIMAVPSAYTMPRVGTNGLGLASVLAFLALNQPDDFHSIQQRLRTVIPVVDRIRFDLVPAKIPMQFYDQSHTNDKSYRDLLLHTLKKFDNLLIFDFVGSRNVPAQLASEGTILVLGLLTVLMGRGRPNLILLDDIDRGLHPKAQREVVGLLRLILEQNPELQIVATTHSPYLLDNLRPEEVRLTTLGDDGTVSVAGLTDHPDFDRWKDEMAPGEMWSMFGESWVSNVKKDVGED